MKNLKFTAFALFMSISTIFAQSDDGNPKISDNWTVKEVIIADVETDEYETDEIKQIVLTEVYTPVMLDPKDKYELNQDIIFMPTQVTKTIKLDMDADEMFDQEVKFDYEKSEDYDLDFTLTKDGIIILTDKDNLYVKNIWDNSTMYRYTNVRKNRVKAEGNYTIELTDGEKIEVKISNYNRM